MVSDHPDDDNTKMYIFVINKDENYNRNGCFYVHYINGNHFRCFYNIMCHIHTSNYKSWKYVEYGDPVYA